MEDKVEKLIQDIYKLKQSIAAKEYTITALKANITEESAEVEKLSEELLSELKSSNTHVYELADKQLVAEKFARENVGYTSESDVLNWLKTNLNGQFIKTKVTESLDKNALKKALKKDENLAKHLEAMTVKNITEYVVVTDFENHQKMLEHINDKSTK